ncbi:putative ribonuclease H-like domain-containing protein [Tanacetum coccineum]
MVPRAVLMKTGLKTFNTVRTVNTAHPKSTVFSAKPMSCFPKIAQSTVRRPFQSKTALSNKRFTHKVNTAKAQAVNTARPQVVNTARPKIVKTARPNSTVVNVVRVNQENGKPQQDDTGFVDSGCSRHMTGNIAYLSDFKEFDRGYVTFGGGAHGGRISSKGTLKTDSLDFEDLPDESQILLKIPRKDNMYSFDMKNIVPKETLTCLVAKATSDESMLWHRRLGHINFKNINKLVKDNLVRGLPTKHFENDQTCVACLKGKQHRASFATGTIINESAGTQEELNADGPHNESDEKDKSEDDSSPKEVNAAGQHVNTASPEVNTSRFKLNTVDPLVNTASYYELYSPKDMFKLGASHTLETTHVEFFSDEDEPEVDLESITNSYTVLTAPNTRIHKDHLIKNVIGDVKSSIQTRRMTKSTSEQGFLKDIGTKWVFRNKKDERGIVIRNKERLVVQGHRQEEGIDYDEVFAPAARIEAIRLFLAYASYMGILVYQMDVKSVFLYVNIEEEVYVTQPPGFKDPNHPDKVYKVVKALYGLHQALRAWYETLDNYLLGNGFKRGKIDQTLFIKKQKGDILLVQVYVDDIIFGSTNKELCTAFEKLMKDKFQMSSMGELTFFLGLQSASTPVDLEKPLVKYGDADDVDVHLYRSMIRDSPFELVAYTDSDYAGATQDRKSTTGGSEYVAADSCCGQVRWIQNQLLDYGYNFMNTVINIDNNNLLTKGFDAGRHVKRDRDTKIPQSSGPPVKVGDEAVHKELGDRMERAATTASSLEAEHDSGNINRTQYMATLNEPIP